MASLPRLHVRRSTCQTRQVATTRNVRLEACGDCAPQAVRKIESGIAQVLPRHATPLELLHPACGAHHRRLPGGAFESDTYCDQETHQPDLRTLVTLTTVRRSTEALIVEIIETVEYEGEQPLFLLAIDHPPQHARSGALLRPRNKTGSVGAPLGRRDTRSIQCSACEASAAPSAPRRRLDERPVSARRGRRVSGDLPPLPSVSIARTLSEPG